MILAGDIGGTKTNLGLFDVTDGALTSRIQRSFPSKRFPGLESIVDVFMSTAGRPSVDAACFGVAGPIIEARSVTPNLPWILESESLASGLELERVILINDVEATAYGIGELKVGEFTTLNQGAAEQGNAALIAAGTGLGSATLFWDGEKHVPSASEAGHMDYAPRDELETRMMLHLSRKHGHVSIERVLSGPGLFAIYEFLRDTGYAAESPVIAKRIEENDPSSVVSHAALNHECGLSEKALDLFVSIYGATAGNIALMVKAVAGIYVGGGIAPKIIVKLKDGTFMKAFTAKGRLAPLLEAIPVCVILNDKTALLGAARLASRQVTTRTAI
jgi:glucokinase